MDISPVIFQGEKLSRDLFWQLPNSDAFRRGPWKYVRVAKEEMLFNLDNDPADEKNLAKEKPELLRELKGAHRKEEASRLTHYRSLRFQRTLTCFRDWVPTLPLTAQTLPCWQIRPLFTTLPRTSLHLTQAP
jgi:hypothetical protein